MDSNKIIEAVEQGEAAWQRGEKNNTATTVINRDVLRTLLTLTKQASEMKLGTGAALKAMSERHIELEAKQAAPASSDAVDVNELVVRLTEHAIMELGADEENTLQIEAWGAAVEKEIQSFLAKQASGVSVEEICKMAEEIRQDLRDEGADVGLDALLDRLTARKEI